MKPSCLPLCLIAAAFAMPACGPDVSDIFTPTSSQGGGGNGGGNGGTTTTGSEGGGGTTSSSSSSSSSSSTSSSSTSSSTTMPCEPGDPNADQDGDGFTPNEGDCNDCTAALSPNNLDIAGNGADDDCDGNVDQPLGPCDGGNTPIDHALPVEVAHVVELCKKSQTPGSKLWGITGADWVQPDGSPPPTGAQQLQNFHLGHGVLPNYGPNVAPRAGVRLLALSSGTARRPGDPGYQPPSGFNKGYQSPYAPGFPKETPSCPGAISGQAYDATALEVKIRAPANAHGFSYDFSFYAYDFPAFVCTQYNDLFFTILSPQVPGQPDGNVAYDELGNPVTLNAANFRVCGCNNGPPCLAGGKMYECPLGTGQLTGTGYDDPNGSRGATGWLTATVPIEPGSEFSIRWGAHDTADAMLESTALIDNWQWITTPGVTLGTKIAE